MVNPSEPFLGSESLIHGLYPTVGSDDFVQIAHSFIFSSACDYNSTSDHASILPGSHAILNGNSSSSEPAWAMKLELPSLQTAMGSWGSPSSPLPSLESVDTLIQTPPEHTQSCNLSPRNSGLLDAVLYESQIMKISSSSFHRQISHALDMNGDTMDTSRDILDTSSQDLHKTEWKTHCESVSPSGYKAKEATDLVLRQYDNSETTNEMTFSRPDFLLASNSFGLPRNIPC